jgi:hypothetical protein
MQHVSKIPLLEFDYTLMRNLIQLSTDTIKLGSQITPNKRTPVEKSLGIIQGGSNITRTNCDLFTHN